MKFFRKITLSFLPGACDMSSFFKKFPNCINLFRANASTDFLAHSFYLKASFFSHFCYHKLFLSWKISQRLSYLFYSFFSWLFCLVKRFTFQGQAVLFSFSECGSFLAWRFLLPYEFLVQQLVLLYLSVVAAFFVIYPFPSKLGKPFYFPSTLPLHFACQTLSEVFVIS